MAVLVAKTESTILISAIDMLVKAAQEHRALDHSWCEVMFCIDNLKEAVAAATRLKVSLEYERMMADKEVA